MRMYEWVVYAETSRRSRRAEPATAPRAPHITVDFQQTDGNGGR